MIARTLLPLFLAAIGWFLPVQVQALGASTAPQRVSFLSADGSTQLTGYLYRPVREFGRSPAVVMLHGRSGAYSSRARGVYDGTTLSSRNRWWGELFAQQGYAALIVDDFSALGYPSGFPAGSYRKRPADVSEVYRRPLHAYGALVYLQSRPEIDGEQIGLIGWSNGGTAALAAIADDLYGGYSKHRFKAAVAMYPGCGFQQELKGRPYRSSAPVRILIGNADTEVSAATCTKLVSESRIADKAFSLTTYEGAQHGFDTPVRTVQNLLANSEARKDAIRVVLHFFDMHLTST